MYESELVKYYDVMHQHRNYPQECQFAANLIQQYHPGTTHILDIGCGTGEHAINMAHQGYTVTAIDTSPDMLQLAQEKSKRAGVAIDFRCTDLHTLQGIEKSQAIYCLGYMLLYLTTYEEIMSFLTTVYQALEPQGVFLVDFINGWSLLNQYPRDKFVYTHENTTIMCFQQASLKKQERVRHIEFYYVIDHHDGEVHTIFAEEDLRIFFDDEVQFLLSMNGFQQIASFRNYGSETQEPTDISTITLIAGQKHGDS